MIDLEKIKKEDVVALMAELKKKNFSNEDLAVMLGRSGQTIWSWSSMSMPKRIPCKSEFEALRHLLAK